MKYDAFLRAINVGGHVVKMEMLRAYFEALGLSKVETFIASGNVIFESRAKLESLQARIEARVTFRGVNTVKKLAAKFSPTIASA